MSSSNAIPDLDGRGLTTAEVVRVAREKGRVQVAGSVVENLDRVRAKLLQVIQHGTPHYGVNTGFGALGRERIDASSLETLQTNLIRSHSTGVGEPLPPDVVRGTMLLLAASLSRGLSGVRPAPVLLLTELLNHDIVPVVPETGSVGASGDLAPLSHIALAMMGEGPVTWNGSSVSSREALGAAGLAPLQLQAKEGLALINGTHLMAARGALLVEDFKCLFSSALVAAAMSVDTSRATDATLDDRVHRARNQAGQLFVARQLRRLLNDSEIVRSHLEDDPRVQDPYSFRCCPAVLGSAWDAFRYVQSCISDELSAVTDNPLIFEEAPPEGAGETSVNIVSGGNFHGMPLALALDVMSIALSHIAGISERRIYHMLSGADPEAELPTFLTPQAGLQSGLMIAQYAAAACCNELIGLANPASVANLSTSAGMEDYNSFGPRSAAKAARGLELARSVIAIELLCAATGLDHHRPLRSGSLVEQAYDLIRKTVPPLQEDRPPAPDIRAIESLIEQDGFAFGAELES